MYSSYEAESELGGQHASPSGCIKRDMHLLQGSGVVIMQKPTTSETISGIMKLDANRDLMR